MSKTGVGIRPIGHKSMEVKQGTANFFANSKDDDLLVTGLVTYRGPSGVEDRHAWIHLTRAQAEHLCFELAWALKVKPTL